ncbi:MAG TPA: AMP-binding protein [Rectinema sp.]|jgi:long-chain acyl-CoA synthetase|nr:AMP-binding protein [Rectinema sp.]HOE76138.1 AMP-binding protein [Rectinema sp.]HOH05715.1 AMP-binding protein [Rectinema sp.]HOR48361.1 AMP-binding protein [Rectinema sp.]HQB07050.1 AMP-binding protein [Rectinema sp.]
MLAFKKFNLAELPELSAAKYDSRPALSMVVGSVYTYRDFERLSRGIAQALASNGIKKGDRVALLAENSPQWVIAWFGIVRAGAIVVPILNDFMPKQIANIIQHSGAKIVFASNKLKAKLVEISPEPEIWDVSKDFEPSADSVELPAVEADDLAMIVYTSGTTGISKGVMLSHRNILSNAIACKSIITLRRTDRLLSILPLAHTYEFTIGMVIPLLYGAHIFYLDRPPSASALLPALKAVRPTIMLSVPLVIEKVYQSGIAPELNGMKLYKNKLMRPLILRIAGMKLKKTFGGHLRFFGIGGAPLAAEVEEFLKKAHFPYAIGYGLTETAPLIAGCAPKATFLRSTGPVLKGVELRIANPKTSTGEGEIQARGPNIFKGYWKDEARTKEAFTEDGWFCTGDLGSIDNKGRLFVRGRLKTLILGASGENIYPEEIESILNQMPEVEESLVVEEEDGLTALVCLKSEVLDNIGARLQDHLDAVGDLGSRVGQAIAQAEKSVTGSVNQALTDTEKAIERLLENIRKEANSRLAAFSRIQRVKLHPEPFEKTPTQKIKRFLYGKKGEKPELAP